MERSLAVALAGVALSLIGIGMLFALDKEVVSLKEELELVRKIVESDDSSKGQVVWYGARGPDQQDSGAFGRIRDLAFEPQYRDRPVMNIEDAKLVILDWPDAFTAYSSGEIAELGNYVGNGGRLILAMDNDYFYCDPPTTCAMEMAKNFGFVFRGNIGSGLVIPADGQASHPIWTSPHRLSSSSELAWDGYVDEILDSNVKVLARIQGSVTSSTNNGDYLVNEPIAIVLNEDPTFNGGKVLGIGRNMFVPVDDNYSMFDNIVSFMTAS